MYSAVTVKSRQRRMKDFFNLEGSKYILIGRESAWENEMIPPVPTGSETELDEFIAAKLVDNQWYVKRLVDPTEEEMNESLYYKGHYYYFTTIADDAIENGCTDIILFAKFDSDVGNLPLKTFRQVGLQVQVDHNADVVLPDKWSVLPSKGALEVIENRKPQPRANDQEEDIYMLINF